MSTRVLKWFDAIRWTMDVQLDGRVFTFRITYNERIDTWTFDLIDGEGDRLLSGVRIVKDYPLLPGWRDERFPRGQLFAISPRSSVHADPGRDDFIGDQPRFRFAYTEEDEE